MDAPERDRIDVLENPATVRAERLSYVDFSLDTETVGDRPAQIGAKAPGACHHLCLSRDCGSDLTNDTGDTNLEWSPGVLAGGFSGAAVRDCPAFTERDLNAVTGRDVGGGMRLAGRGTSRGPGAVRTGCTLCRLGIPVWSSRAEQIQQTMARFSKEQLELGLKLIFAADRDMRSTRPDDRIVMEKFIFELTR